MILRLLGLFIVLGMMCMSDAEAKDDKKTIPEKAPAQEFSQAPSITKGTVNIKGICAYGHDIRKKTNHFCL